MESKQALHNHGTVELWFKGQAVPPGTPVPDEADPAQVAYFVQVGILKEGPPPATVDKPTRLGPAPKKKEGRS